MKFKSKSTMAMLLFLALLFSSCTSPSTTSSTTLTETTTITTTHNKTTSTESQSETSSTQVRTETLPIIKYDDVINKDMYSGFTQGQIEQLNKNGFIVLEPNYDKYSSLFMHHLYEGAEYTDQAVFITTDSVLNTFHIFYGNSLKALESTHYYNVIGTLSNRMLQKMDTAYHNADKALKPYYSRLYAYFLVGGKLLYEGEPNFVNGTINPKRSIEDDSFYTKAVANEETWLKLYAQAPKEILTLVDTEYQKIEKATGILKSEILNKEIDYSQYIVRGHYTQSNILSHYFKSMMWYSQSGFDIDAQKIESIILAELLTLEMLSDPELITTWDQFYTMTSFYSGVSDDLNHQDIETFMKKAYGDQYKQLSTLKGKTYLLSESAKTSKIHALSSLPLSKIAPVIKDESNKGLSYSRQYRFMGQRFTFDAHIMTKLVHPPKRLNISSFDVLATMGNQDAEDILYQYYRPDENWKGYPEALAKVKKEYQHAKQTYFSDDLYHGWLEGISIALNETFEGKVQAFMQSKAYAYKRVNTALGSFAELKHDNLLYAKQMVAEAGGMDDERGMPLHYVEPNVALYKHLKSLAQKARAGLVEMEEEALAEPLDEMIKYLDLFITVSEKELKGEMISQEELKEIAYYGGMVDYLRTSYNYYISMLALGDFIEERSSALISDIATILGSDKPYLELGIGLPYEIYALCEVNGEPVLTMGVVYSSYEFFYHERLTNTSWQEMNGIYNNETTNHYTEYDGSKVKVHLSDFMPYTKIFMSPESNGVKIKHSEMHWPKK